MTGLKSQALHLGVTGIKSHIDDVILEKVGREPARATAKLEDLPGAPKVRVRHELI